MNKTFLLTALCGSVIAATGYAQSPNSQDDRPRGPVDRLIAAVDVNHDGVISKEEIDGAAAALKTLDANQDGTLTREELAPAPLRGGRRGGSDADRPANRPTRGGRFGGFGNPIVRTLDGNRDGALSDAELSGAPAALKSLDTNGDGQISRDELGPAPRRGERPRQNR